MRLDTLKIGPRLLIAFGSTLVLMAIVAAIGLLALEESKRHIDEVVHVNARKVHLVNEMSQAVHVVSSALGGMLLASDTNAVDQEIKHLLEARGRYDRAWDELSKMPASEAGKVMRAKIDAAKIDTRAVNNQILELVKQRRAAEAVRLHLSVAAPKVAAWQTALQENVVLQEADNERAYQDVVADVSTARAQLLVATLMAIVVSLVGAWLITRSITLPLHKAVQSLERVAGGDLTETVSVSGRDELSRLFAALDTMLRQLRATVAQVRAGVDQVGTASSQIAAGNQDLSSRTEQQASSLQQTAASMEQLTSTVKQSADNANQANQLAASASEAAERGGQVVCKVVATMDDITAASRKIADIIGVIDGIAFQTNILALNAAVEAARAGEQGRGFAVVAGEVRNLAQRSAQAAREIKSLIGDSVQRIDAGGQLVGDAGRVMSEIVIQVQRVSHLIAEITSATQEQASGIGQINDAVTQMDQATQQNAALVEESAAAAQSLREQAAALSQSVAAFRLSPESASQSQTQIASSQVPTDTPGRMQSKRPPDRGSRAPAGQTVWTEF